jgi:hypothetical protein
MVYLLPATNNVSSFTFIILFLVTIFIEIGKKCSATLQIYMQPYSYSTYASIYDNVENYVLQFYRISFEFLTILIFFFTKLLLIIVNLLLIPKLKFGKNVGHFEIWGLK